MPEENIPKIVVGKAVLDLTVLFLTLWKDCAVLKGAVNFCCCPIALVFCECRNYRCTKCQSSNKISWAVKGDAGLHGGIPMVQAFCNPFVSRPWTYEAQVTCARVLPCNCTWRSYKELWWNFYTNPGRSGIIYIFFNSLRPLLFKSTWNRGRKVYTPSHKNFWKLFKTS